MRRIIKGAFMQNFHELHYTPSGVAITGVKEVYEYSDKEIVLGLSEGGLRLVGKDFKLMEVELEKGSLKASGTLLALSYGGHSKEGFLKKLFK